MAILSFTPCWSTVCLYEVLLRVNWATVKNGTCTAQKISTAWQPLLLLLKSPIRTAYFTHINPLTPKDPCSGRTAPLISKRCILYIYSTNTGTGYFKHGIYCPFFSLQNAVCFIILTYLVPVLFAFYIQDVLKLKKNNSGAKRLIISTSAHRVDYFPFLSIVIGFYRLSTPVWLAHWHWTHCKLYYRIFSNLIRTLFTVSEG